GDVVAVTNVSYDHVEALGPTLRDIAREKAGIIKPASQLVLGEPTPELAQVFVDAAGRVGARGIWRRGSDFDCDVNHLAVGGRLVSLRTPTASYDELYLPLHGAHQGENAALAVACAEAFFGTALAEDTVAAALASVRVPGRFEVVGRSPLVVLDGAHNVAGAHALAATLAEMHPQGGIVSVIGMLRGRDPSAVFQALSAGGVSAVVTCTAPSPRAIPAVELAEAARAVGLEAQSTDAVPDAVTLALGRASVDDMVVVTGSLYVVAEARSRLVTAGGAGSGSAGQRR
ncbi:MAG TPA: cyanophycin synthetase, partial [Acidimicrobiales bacterium]|nr:cyanophycin synthetase [Acidimicrobiales bacterium]